jgi:hypothetical protein
MQKKPTPNVEAETGLLPDRMRWQSASGVTCITSHQERAGPDLLTVFFPASFKTT